MALEPQTQEIPFRFGLDKTEDEEGNPNGFQELVNWDFDKEGALVRRHGFEIASSAIFPVYGSQADVFLRAGDSVTVLDRFTPVLTSRSVTTLSNGARVQHVDAATESTSQYTCVVQTTQRDDATVESVYWVVDNVTGAIATYGTLGAGTWGVQVAAVRNTVGGTNSGWAIYYLDGTVTADLKYRKLALSGFTLGSASTVASALLINADNGLPMAVAAAPAGGSTYVAYTEGGGQITLKRHDDTGSALATLSPAGATVDASHCSVWLYVQPSGQVDLFYRDNSNILTLKWITVTLSAVTGTKQIATSVSAGDFTTTELATNVLIVFYRAAGVLTIKTYNITTDSLSSDVMFNNAYLATKATTILPDGVTPFAVVGVTAADALITNYKNISLLAFSAPGASLPVGQLAFDEAGVFDSPPDEYTMGLPSWSVSGASKLVIPVPVDLAAGKVTGSSDLIMRRARLTEVAYGSARKALSTAGLLTQGYVSGSVLQMYDGKWRVPAAFMTPPPRPSVSAGAGGSLTPGDVHTYATVLEYTDSRGVIQTSPPSRQISRTAGGTGSNLVEAYTYTYLPSDNTGKPLRLKLYRTAAGGSTFTLVKSFLLSANTNVGTASVSWDDGESDTTIASREPLYSTGAPTDALVSELVPPFDHITSHRNRLFGVDANGVIRFSQEVSDAQAPRFNTVLTLRVDNSSGPALAVASLADRLLIFQRDQVSVIMGQGPDANGNGAFSLPEVLQSTKGVGVDPAQIGSVVETPDGVMFAHRTGIYLITADGQLAPVGRALGGKTFGADVTITRARYLPSRNQVWFLASGIVYVWDVRWRRWTTFTGVWDTLTDVIDLNGTVYALSTRATVAGVYSVLVFSPSSYRDEDPATPGTYVAVSQTLSLPWFRGDRAQAMRLWRVHLSGRRNTSFSTTFTLTLQAYSQSERELTKESTTVDDTYTWTGAQVASLPTNWLLSSRLVSQRGRAFRCRITVTPTSTVDPFNAYLTLSALTYDYGILPSRGKQPSARRPTIA
jgi:hypothetical protein